MIGIPRPPVGLAEDQVIILPRLAGPEPGGELDLAVLPARFDNSELPGLLPDVVAIDLRRYTPEQFADLVVEKLAALGIILLDASADTRSLAHSVETAPPAGAVRAGEADSRRLGVHAAISAPGAPEEVPPEYVPRDADAGVRAGVAAAAERGGFVLLVGGSSVGKTRIAVEAVRALLPDWWLVHPAGPAEVAALAQAPSPRIKVWVDELQRYLDGEHGLTGGVVRALLNARYPAVIIGTLWPDRYIAHTTIPVLDGADPHAREREVLDLAAVVRIDPEFTPAEQDRARAAAARDPRPKVALEAAGYGLTQDPGGRAAAGRPLAGRPDRQPVRMGCAGRRAGCGPAGRPRSAQLAANDHHCRAGWPDQRRWHIASWLRDEQAHTRDQTSTRQTLAGFPARVTCLSSLGYGPVQFAGPCAKARCQVRVSNKTSAGPASKPIGVFVLEDQEIVRRGIRVLLEAEPDIEVTGKASTAASALARIPALRPGVAVLDVQLPDGDRVSVCREVRSRAPEVACLMLTAFNDDEALLGSIMAERPATCSSRSAARIWSARSAWSPPVSRCWMLAR